MFLHYNISKTFASIVTLKKKEKKTGSEEYLKKKSLENDPMRISMKKKMTMKNGRGLLYLFLILTR